jgi:hypothetical protein
MGIDRGHFWRSMLLDAISIEMFRWRQIFCHLAKGELKFALLSRYNSCFPLNHQVLLPYLLVST